jgi:hypothetical protein
VTSEQIAEFRDHALVITNPNTVQLANIVCRLQLPEAVVGAGHEAPVGVVVRFHPDRPQFFASGSGGGSVTRFGSPLATGVWRLEADRLPAHGVLRVSFRTGITGVAEKYSSRNVGSLGAIGLPGAINFYLSGSFQSEVKGTWITRRFLSPIEATNRSLRVVETVEDVGDRVVATQMFFS